MLAGAFATAFSLLALAWAREIVHGFLGIFGADPNSNAVKTCAIIWAIVCVWVLDFAINTGEHWVSDTKFPSLTSHSTSRCTSLHS